MSERSERYRQRVQQAVAGWRGSPTRAWFGARWSAWLDALLPRAWRAAAPAPPAALPLAACVSVVIPALNEASRIASVVAYALADPATAEVIVVDDGSIDDTAALARDAGAQVLASGMLGKGVSMQEGALTARCEVVVYLDGDLAGLRPGIVSDLTRPLLRDEADFVKASFGRGGGRVTELTARPMLKVFFPELAHFVQPLGGIVAARRTLLRSLDFEDGYGVDIGLLIDAQRAGARLAEVDIGSLEHDSQPLLDLGVMANEVSRVVFARAKAAGRLHVDQIAAMYETQRLASADIGFVLTRRRGRQRLLLLSMEGCVTPTRFDLELARATGHAPALRTLLAGRGSNGSTAGTLHNNNDAQQERIAALFRFVHRSSFEEVARMIEVRPGVLEFVKQMRRAGFMVGLLSDSYFIAADIVRRRIYADFALAPLMQFDADVCTGQWRANPAFQPRDHGGATAKSSCKSEVLCRFREDSNPPPLQICWAVGDAVADLELLRGADRAFVLDAKAPGRVHASGFHAVASFGDLLALVPAPPSAEGDVPVSNAIVAPTAASSPTN